MWLIGRSIAMLLVLALAGGAQACVALCALPAATANSSKQDGACTHCSQKQSEKSRAPATPCKHCQVISQERWATQGDQSANIAFGWTSPLLIADLVQPINCADRATPVSPGRPHLPQGERLHQFCLLLI
jgi:hypothetical protein